MQVFDLLNESAEANQAIDKLTLGDLKEQEKVLRDQGLTDTEINAVLWLTAMEKSIIAHKAGENVESWQQMADATKEAISEVTEEIIGSNS
ncbi:MAG: hypothetical protein ACYTFY_20455 [Planctomycetota bacterium]|jgi:transcriptional regulator